MYNYSQIVYVYGSAFVKTTHCLVRHMLALPLPLPPWFIHIISIVSFSLHIGRLYGRSSVQFQTIGIYFWVVYCSFYVCLDLIYLFIERTLRRFTLSLSVCLRMSISVSVGRVVWCVSELAGMRRARGGLCCRALVAPRQPIRLSSRTETDEYVFICLV